MVGTLHHEDHSQGNFERLNRPPWEFVESIEAGCSRLASRETNRLRFSARMHIGTGSKTVKSSSDIRDHRAFEPIAHTGFDVVSPCPTRLHNSPARAK